MPTWETQSLAGNSPSIAPVSQEGHRPFWSVMIPTFNCAQYLRQTLESVLEQAPDAAQMQIEVVDDGSTKDDPEVVVQEVGKGRVSFYRKPQNGGAIANFNTCLERSRGQLVHILHGDDYVLSGFYAKVTDMAENHPEVEAFFTRCTIVDERGGLEDISGRVPQLVQPSHLPGDLLYANDLMTPGIVIRRTFYEAHGGFLPELIHVADWEMWIRSIRKGGGLWLNELLAAYRFFAGNDTGRLTRTAGNLRDCLKLAKIFEAQVDGFDSARFRETIAHRARRQEKLFAAIGDKDAARANKLLWNELTPGPVRWGVALRDKLLPEAKRS